MSSASSVLALNLDMDPQGSGVSVLTPLSSATYDLDNHRLVLVSADGNRSCGPQDAISAGDFHLVLDGRTYLLSTDPGQEAVYDLATSTLTLHSAQGNRSCDGLSDSIISDTTLRLEINGVGFTPIITNVVHEYEDIEVGFRVGQPAFCFDFGSTKAGLSWALRDPNNLSPSDEPLFGLTGFEYRLASGLIAIETNEFLKCFISEANGNFVMAPEGEPGESEIIFSDAFESGSTGGPGMDIRVEFLTPPPSNIVGGDTLAYSFRVSNVGDVDASPVAFQDYYPADGALFPDINLGDGTWLCESSSGASCGQTPSGVRRIRVEDLYIPVGEHVDFLISNRGVSITAEGPVLFAAGAAGEGPEIFRDDNTVQLARSGLLAPPQPAALEITPASHDFGDVELGGTESFVFTVHNTGDPGESLELTQIELTPNSSGAASVFLIDSSPGSACSVSQVLDGGDSCTVTIEFSPSMQESDSATLNVNSNLASGGSDSATVSGRGVQPDMQVSPTFVNFGQVEVFTPSAVEIVTVSNTGSGTLQMNAISSNLGANFQYLNVPRGTAGNCPIDNAFELPEGESCNLEIQYVPQTQSTHVRAIDITNSNGQTTLVELGLQGQGVPPAPAAGTLSVTSDSLDLDGEQLIQGQSTNLRIAADNVTVPFGTTLAVVFDGQRPGDSSPQAGEGVCEDLLGAADCSMLAAAVGFANTFTADTELFNGTVSVDGQAEPGTWLLRFFLVEDDNGQTGPVVDQLDVSITIVQTGSIAGTVTVDVPSPIEGGGIAGNQVLVEALDLQGEVMGSDVSDAAGEYLIDGLMPGLYEVRASQAGFTTEWAFEIEVQAATTTSGIDLGLESTLQADFTMWAFGSNIDGQHFAVGQDIEEVDVSVMRSDEGEILDFYIRFQPLNTSGNPIGFSGVLRDDTITMLNSVFSSGNEFALDGSDGETLPTYAALQDALIEISSVADVFNLSGFRLSLLDSRYPHSGSDPGLVHASAEFSLSLGDLAVRLREFEASHLPGDEGSGTVQFFRRVEPGRAPASAVFTVFTIEEFESIADPAERQAAYLAMFADVGFAPEQIRGLSGNDPAVITAPEDFGTGGDGLITASYTLQPDAPPGVYTVVVTAYDVSGIDPEDVSLSDVGSYDTLASDSMTVSLEGLIISLDGLAASYPGGSSELGSEQIVFEYVEGDQQIEQVFNVFRVLHAGSGDELTPAEYAGLFVDVSFQPNQVRGLAGTDPAVITAPTELGEDGDGIVSLGFTLESSAPEADYQLELTSYDVTGISAESVSLADANAGSYGIVGRARSETISLVLP